MTWFGAIFMDTTKTQRKSPFLPRDTALPLLLNHPLAFRNRYRWALAWLMIGATCDLFTTLWNLREYGSEIEVHIVQRWLSDWLGVDVGVPLAKGIQLVFVLLVAAWWRPWCRWILGVCGTLYLVASISNYFLLF
jgi:hypothetical protein